MALSRYPPGSGQLLPNPIDPETSISESATLTRSMIGNVVRARRAEQPGRMNPPLTRYTEPSTGKPLRIEEIAGWEDETMVDPVTGQAYRVPGLAEIMGQDRGKIGVATVRRWFGTPDKFGRVDYANCVPLSLAGAPPRFGNPAVEPKTVLSCTPDERRRILLAACVICPNGLTRTDDEGFFEPVATPKPDRSTQGTWRDVHQQATLADALTLVEAYYDGEFADHSGIDSSMIWLRIMIRTPQQASEIEQSAKEAGVRPGEGWELITYPQTNGWYIVVDRIFPYESDGDTP